MTAAIALPAGVFSACNNPSVTSAAAASIGHPASVGASGPGTQTNSTALPALPLDPKDQSRVLTDFLKAHGLPLVGASVVPTGGSRRVILYGFVATEQGKADAEKQVRQLVNDHRVLVVDRVLVQPELLAMDQSTDSANPHGATRSGGDVFSQIGSHTNYPASDQTQQYEAQRQSIWTKWLVMALMIAPIFIP
jgi:hypothetical protein